MARIPYLADTWEIVKEVDLRPLRQQALRGVNIAIVGAPDSQRLTLAEKMRSDPARPEEYALSPVLILDLEDGGQAAGVDLIILLMDSDRPNSAREQELVINWHNANKRVLVFINQIDSSDNDSMALSPWTKRTGRGVVWGAVEDNDFLLKKFAPAVINLIPDHLLGLGRAFPLFRTPIANYLINDTCISNAAYALSTGLAETVAVFDIPIAVADTIILTKNQAYMAYKIGLALGYSTQWKDYIAEFGSVLGGGFLWRQVARTLVGLVPVWGLAPKTAIAYAGTYAVGHAILQWYLTGRHLSRQQIQQLYRQAFERGKTIAANLMGKIPRPKIKRPQLPKVSDIKLPKLARPRLSRRKQKALPAPETPRLCPQCDQTSASDAVFCQYCGAPFENRASINEQIQDQNE